MSGQRYTSIGGQAVLEGVMMRSPRYMAVAVRRPDGQIAIKSKPYAGWSARFPILKKPILRGVVTLLESMIQGMDALGYSAQIASVEDSKGPANQAPSAPLTKTAIAMSMAMAFGMSMLLFVGFPHLVSAWIADVQSPVFHAADGIIKVAVLLGYVGLIGRIPEIRRVFQFHGAEHQSIYTFESGETLTPQNAARHTRLHPRCGTSFLLFLVLISIATFTIVFPVLGFTRFSEVAILNHLAMIGLKIALMLPISGVAYEFIRTCAGRMDQWIYRVLIWPGLQLQYLTTRTPDESQLEVALASLREVLRLEKMDGTQPAREQVIHQLAEIPEVGAQLQEFPE